MDPNAVLNRVVRLARLDTSVFDEVKDDVNETVPALVVLAVSCLLAGLGAFLYYWLAVDDRYDFQNEFLNTVILGSIFTGVLYVAALAIAYVVLVQMYRVTVDFQALLRTGGYASIPLAGSLLMLIPVLWPIFAIVPLALLMVMMIYAVQSASNAESNHVVIATAAGYTVMVLVLGFIALQFQDFSAQPDTPIGAGLFGTLYDLS